MVLIYSTLYDIASVSTGYVNHIFVNYSGQGVRLIFFAMAAIKTRSARDGTAANFEDRLMPLS
jgi:hypothetical protein